MMANCEQSEEVLTRSKRSYYGGYDMYGWVYIWNCNGIDIHLKLLAFQYFKSEIIQSSIFW